MTRYRPAPAAPPLHIPPSYVAACYQAVLTTMEHDPKAASAVCPGHLRARPLTHCVRYPRGRRRVSRRDAFCDLCYEFNPECRREAENPSFPHCPCCTSASLDDHLERLTTIITEFTEIASRDHSA